MNLFVNFKRSSLIYQTLVVAVIFLTFYSLYMQFQGESDIGESLLATVIFASSYFATSTLVLRRKIRSKR